MNTGGWLALTGAFGFLMLLVQRTERKRRLVSLGVLAFVALILWRYAIYRLSTNCDVTIQLLCSFDWVHKRMVYTAITTVNWSIVAALLLNLLFWILIGRSNPPGSSDSIKVFGMDD